MGTSNALRFPWICSSFSRFGCLHVDGSSRSFHIFNSFALFAIPYSQTNSIALCLVDRRLFAFICFALKRISDCRLYTFVDTAYLNGRDVAFVAQQLCDGGSDIIQLRAKNSSPEEIRRVAEIILPI